ncbi:ABC transporter ATP-binding protein [Streptomyces sp. CA-111067]|uniref:ABC transporter ATP-binding protein n=1 Tax=Streptomyces sp. CA-111067 TaxID=3240046 RepID=UPI003D97499C
MKSWKNRRSGTLAAGSGAVDGRAVDGRAVDGHAVELRSVTRTYGSGPSAVRALERVSVAFPAGTFTAVMGPSGSGKSTLLQCAAGLDRPTSGSVLLGGTELTALSQTGLTLLRRQRIGFVFQSYNLLPALTAEQNVALPLRLAGRRPDPAQMREALARVGLADRGRHRPSELSGGQQQRVALARALITAPEVLFGDEPTGALDSAGAREVLGLLREMVRGDGRTVVMVTHDPVAAGFADRVVFLADGRVSGELLAPTAESVAARMTRMTGAAPSGGSARAPVVAPRRAAAPTGAGTWWPVSAAC